MKLFLVFKFPEGFKHHSRRPRDRYQYFALVIKVIEISLPFRLPANGSAVSTKLEPTRFSTYATRVENTALGQRIYENKRRGC